jgi:uncharacterized phage-associated protein
MATINEDKYRNALLFFVSTINNNTLGKVKLMKLFYYLDFDHFEQFGTSVTGDDYLHWGMGPVPASASIIIDRMVADDQLLVESVDVGMPNHWVKYTALRNYNIQVFTSTEVAVLYAVAQKWEHHSGGDMVRAVHGEPPWLETAPNAVIDYRLALKRSGKDRELPEEHMDEQMTAEDREAREKGLQLVARLEQLVQTDQGFCTWLQVGFDQIESGQTVTFGIDGWEED